MNHKATPPSGSILPSALKALLRQYFSWKKQDGLPSQDGSTVELALSQQDESARQGVAMDEIKAALRSCLVLNHGQRPRHKPGRWRPTGCPATSCTSFRHTESRHCFCRPTRMPDWALSRPSPKCGGAEQRQIPDMMSDRIVSPPRCRCTISPSPGPPP